MEWSHHPLSFTVLMKRPSAFAEIGLLCHLTTWMYAKGLTGKS